MTQAHTPAKIAATFEAAGHVVSAKRCNAIAALIAAEGWPEVLTTVTFTTDPVRRDVGFYNRAISDASSQCLLPSLRYQADVTANRIENPARHADALADLNARIARLEARALASQQKAA